MKASEVMNKDVATCLSTDTLNRAAQLMWEQRRGCVPVLDERRHVVGMLSDRDVGMAAYTQGRPLTEIPVTVAMSRSVWGCLPSAPVEEVEDIMMTHGVHRVVVLSEADGSFEGLVSLDGIARIAIGDIGSIGSIGLPGRAALDIERITLTLGEIALGHGPSSPGADAEEIPEEDLASVAQSTLDALETLRDEIRVDLNLAGKEVRDRWRKVEAGLYAAEIKVRHAGHEGIRELAHLVERAQRLRRRLHDRADDGKPRSQRKEGTHLA
jgi:CBS domain-containing protein